MATAFARDYHMRGEIAATRDGQDHRRCACGCSPTTARSTRTAQPSRYPAGFFRTFTGSLRRAGRALPRHRRAHQQGARRRRVRVLVPHDRGVLPRRAPGRRARLRARAGPGRAADAQPAPPRAVPLPVRHRLGVRLRRLPAHAARWPWRWPATRSCARNRRRAGPAARCIGIGVSFFTEAVGAGPRAHMDILGWAWPTARAAGAPDRDGGARGVVQSQGQGHETTFAQIVAEELGIGVDDVEVVHGRHRPTPFGLGTYGSRSTPVSGAATVVAARKVRERAQARRGGDAGGGAGGPGVGRGPLPGARRPGTGASIAGDRHGRALRPRAARRRRGPPGRDGRLQPAQPDVPVRGLHLRGRRGPGHRPGRRPPVHRGGRLRRADQPDDRRGADPRRPRRRRSAWR